ncbi:hypothetical protein Vretimale_17680, partial [Volvox reticuliferus]
VQLLSAAVNDTLSYTAWPAGAPSGVAGRGVVSVIGGVSANSSSSSGGSSGSTSSSANSSSLATMTTYWEEMPQSAQMPYICVREPPMLEIGRAIEMGLTQYVAFNDMFQNSEAYDRCTATGGEFARVNSSETVLVASLLRLTSQSVSGASFWVAGNCTAMYGGWDLQGQAAPGSVLQRPCND